METTRSVTICSIYTTRSVFHKLSLFPDCLNDNYESRGESYSFYNRQSKKGSSGFCPKQQDDSSLGSTDDPILLSVSRGRVKKIICGRVILYRERCPGCGEYNLSGNKTFKCTVCKNTYKEKVVSKIDLLTKNHRRQQVSRKRRKELMIIQDNKCHWCGRQFERWYKRNGLVKQLEICGDHKIPWAYCEHNRDDNFCLSCNICNGKKSDKMFKDEEECREYLLRKWNKELENGTIELL